MKPKTAIILLTLTALLLTARGGFLIYNDYQHDLRLKLVENDLHAFWGRFKRVETPTATIDGQLEASTIQGLWDSQEQAEKEHRQEVIKLINDQRGVLNDQTPDVYPLLLLETHPTLEQSSRLAFENIAETKEFKHQDMTALLSRGEPFDRVGENLAAENNINPTRVVYDWFLSESHRELMLGDFEFVGVASGWVEDLKVEGREPQDFYVTVAHFGE